MSSNMSVSAIATLTVMLLSFSARTSMAGSCSSVNKLVDASLKKAEALLKWETNALSGKGVPVTDKDKQALTDCIEVQSEAIEDIKKGKESVVNGNKNEAISFVSGALSNVDTCRDSFEDVGAVNGSAFSALSPLIHELDVALSRLLAALNGHFRC